MSRYTGPSWKVSRRLGFSILESGRELAKRPYYPGQHGPGRRKKTTEYGKQLNEKQKVRCMYGVNERQFERLFILAKKSSGVTGVEFLRILESRLDNIVYRMGLARTRRGARQLVCHGHVRVDGQKVDIPSFLVKPGQKISLKKKIGELKVVQEALEVAPTLAPFVEFDREKEEGVYLRYPERNELNHEIDEALIVEFYNRKV
ncbi:MAG: 30S ribosomal protein S4 [Bacilli bacterium]|jgi:small subunit ribosomal protein S4